MKTIFKAATLAIALITVPFANAAENTTKIGVLNVANIVQNSPQKNVIIKKLQKEFKLRVEELNKLESQLKALENELKANSELLSDKDKQNIKSKINNLASKYKLTRSLFEQDSKRRQSEEQRALLEQISKAVNEIALKDNFDLILNAQTVVYSKEAFDISNLVIEQLSKK